MRTSNYNTVVFRSVVRMQRGTMSLVKNINNLCRQSVARTSIHRLPRTCEGSQRRWCRVNSHTPLGKKSTTHCCVFTLCVCFAVVFCSVTSEFRCTARHSASLLSKLERVSPSGGRDRFASSTGAELKAFLSLEKQNGADFSFDL